MTKSYENYQKYCDTYILRNVLPSRRNCLRRQRLPSFGVMRLQRKTYRTAHHGVCARNRPYLLKEIQKGKVTVKIDKNSFFYTIDKYVWIPDFLFKKKISIVCSCFLNSKRY